ncbi:hypothetical protein [Pelagovum pacificum]|uniref:Uncharacterized protein n=1 Tax=Pelagovum pacificum TaxID=2588711 RepID=A0A5C5GFU4_9RHOB|nr:hypothetical protein [Pelagovum pacificum]QQA44060.1 hypothetical protein I8N54_05645 [Pelagovum pacificum]TNY32811.1 hypothetical protein FHY64_05915 [Pelagovum pacificum]
MTGPPRTSTFLARASYRRRRMRDASRMLPIFGTVLVLVPLLLAVGEGAKTSAVLIYLFVLWTVLVVVAALLSRIREDETDPPGRDGPPPPAAETGGG